MATTDTSAPPAGHKTTNGHKIAGIHMGVAQLMEYTQGLLDADDERHAQAAGTANGHVSHDLSPGATVDLSKKSMHELPVEVIEIMKERVERLALSHNPQVIIPSQIVKCDRLRYLNVRANHLTEFPESILALSKLEILDLSKNEITSIPEDIKRMTSLRFLAVVRNKISRLPLAFGDMPNLHKLKFEDNPIIFPSAEELQMHDIKDKSGNNDVNKDTEVCMQVKRVMKGMMKSKALRQRLLKSSSEEDVSESNTDTPRPPRRLANGRFPVRPSISGVEGLGDIIRSASNSPPEPPVSAMPRNMGRSPSRIGMNGTTRAPPTSHGNGGDDLRSRSESVSTSASFKMRRQGVLGPQKRNNDPATANQSVRASNASTIKATHGYTASTSSTLSGMSSGADSSAAPSPKNALATQLRRNGSNVRNMLRRSQHFPALQAARRLQRVLFHLSQPLLGVADSIVQGLSERSRFQQHVINANNLTSDLEHLLGMLNTTNGDSQPMLAHKLNIVLRSALNTYSALIESVRAFTSRPGIVTDSYSARCLMFQLYSVTVETRNVAVLLNIPSKSSDTDTRDTPRASTVSQAWSSRTVTPTDAKSQIAIKRMRGATIIRNQASNASLRVVPPSRMPGPNRINTDTSFLSSASPVSAAVSTGTQRKVQRTPIGSSSDEHEENNEQFESIFFKLRDACNIASDALPQCLKEIKNQRDNAAREGHQQKQDAWRKASKSCASVIQTRIKLDEGLNSVQVGDPAVRYTKDFWALCDNFVQSYTEFATIIAQISAHIDTSTIRSFVRPVQRAVKDVSKIISGSSLYHQALRMTNNAPRSLAPPFPVGLNTTLAQAVAQTSSNPPSAAPTSAPPMTTMSMPATPLTAALGPAAQATVASTPSSGPMMDYFPNVAPISGATNRPPFERLDTAFLNNGSNSAPHSATSATSAGGLGHAHPLIPGRR